MVGTVSNKRLEAARATLRAVEIEQGMRSYTQEKLVAAPAPFGVYHLGWNPATLVNALQQVSTHESWTALVGVENFGWEAAASQGLDLSRILVVDCPAEQSGIVVSLLLESVEAVAIGGISVPFPQQKSLLARARKLRRLIFLSRPWPSISRLWLEENYGSALQIVNGGALGRAV